MAICCAFSVAASIILVWRRNYVLAPIAICLAVILLYGILNAGLDGVEMPAFHMVVENEGYIFLSPFHAEDTMWGSSVMLSITSIGLTVYPWLKKKTLVMCAILVFLVVEVIRYGVHMNMTLTIPTSYLYYPYVLSCALGQCRLCRECIGQENQAGRFYHQYPADGPHDVWTHLSPRCRQYRHGHGRNEYPHRSQHLSGE